MAEADVPDLPSPEACVICLERLDQRAIALPCKHDQFDFSCIGTWLHQQRVCPLCKGSVTAVKYDLGKADGGTIYSLPTLNSTPQTSIEAIRYHRRLSYRNSYSCRPESRQRASDARRAARSRVFRGGHVQVTAEVARSSHFLPPRGLSRPKILPPRWQQSHLAVSKPDSILLHLKPGTSLTRQNMDPQRTLCI